jgi:hypothetical protein
MTVEGSLHMLRRIAASLAVLLVLTLLSISPAIAQTASECDALLAQLRADTVAAQGSFTNAKDFTGAIAKLDAADAKLDAGKNADAAAKVSNYQASLNSLATAAKPKLDPAVAEQLVAEAQGVIDCIGAIDAA